MGLSKKPGITRLILPLCWLMVLCCFSGIVQAQTPLKPRTIPREAGKELQYVAYFYTQAVLNNIYARNDFLKGQTVGRLFGGNTTSTRKAESAYFEQRLLPFFIYTPKLMNKRVTLRASFEIDWTWGDVSYGTGGNFGSALSADQVNLQTQNVELELIPWKGVTVNLGLQRLYDTPYHPYRTFFSTMTLTGYRLAFWGSDAVGITVRHDRDFSRYKFGYYQLYENNVQQNDDVVLWEGMAEKDLTPTWRQGISLWYLRDQANGEGGVSILGQGLNSNLTAYNGVFRFDLGNTIANPYNADIFWLGTFWNRNPEFKQGRWMNTGFLISNLGKVTVATNDADREVDIAGWAANLRAGYKYGQTAKDAVTAEFLYASGDPDSLSDDKYTGVITGNTWGAPAAIYISHGTYLLFPHGNVVNRFVGAVNDLSNLGLGLTAAMVNFQKDLIPHKLSAKLGAAIGRSVEAPEKGGKNIGKEVNFMLSLQPKVFMNVELHAAYLWLGDFYNSNAVNGRRENLRDPISRTGKPRNPWTVFLAFKWLMF